MKIEMAENTKACKKPLRVSRKYMSVEERRACSRDASRKFFAKMTPEQRRAYSKEQERKRNAKMTPEQRKDICIKKWQRIKQMKHTNLVAQMIFQSTNILSAVGKR